MSRIAPNFDAKHGTQGRRASTLVCMSAVPCRKRIHGVTVVRPRTPPD